MREFKFIRGIYKNEKIFNTDETNDTLFALYGDGSPISLDIKNDEDFQKKIAGLPSEEREIYTIRPSQFVVSAEKKNNDGYTVSYTLNEKVYDGLKAFPNIIKNAAETCLSEKATAHIPDKPSLILSGAVENSTPVKFTFENKDPIIRHLYFKVTGKMKKFTRTVANDENITAYKVVNNEVKYNDTEEGTFYNGKLQEPIEPEKRKIAPDSITGVNDKNYDDLEVASSYTTEEGFWFVYNDEQLTKTIQYNDPFNTELYKEIRDYLIEATQSEAVNNNVLNQGYIAYLSSNCENLRSCYNDEKAYELLESDYLRSGDRIPTNLERYRFFRMSTSRDPLAYALVGSCVIQPREDIIVESYKDSYSNLFVLESQSLRQLDKDDLIGKEIIEVYTENDESYNFPTFGGVYKNTDDTADYVTLSDEGTEDISSYNATINDSVVSPMQDSYTFRQIENIYINATES
jgi:hypothetical protein